MYENISQIQSLYDLLGAFLQIIDMNRVICIVIFHEEVLSFQTILQSISSLKRPYTDIKL